MDLNVLTAQLIGSAPAAAAVIYMAISFLKHLDSKDKRQQTFLAEKELRDHAERKEMRNELHALGEKSADVIGKTSDALNEMTTALLFLRSVQEDFLEEMRPALTPHLRVTKKGI